MPSGQPALRSAPSALGGAGVAYWGPHRRAVRDLNLTVEHDIADPTFRFMRLDWDGRVAYGLLFTLRHGWPDRVEGANTISRSPAIPDHDRHGIVTNPRAA